MKVGAFLPRSRRVALRGLVLGVIIMAGASAAPAADDALVAAGEALWRRSPDPGNPVACATCHDRETEWTGWAGSFPKWRTLPLPHARVMTLLQANAEAVARHYRVDDPLPAATAITAFLQWRAAGLPLRPGITPGRPVFADRRAALARSTRRGARAFARHCHACHSVKGVAGAAQRFPRVAVGRAESLETFVERHSPNTGRFAWNSPRTADLLAFLASQVAPAAVRAETSRDVASSDAIRIPEEVEP